MKFILNVLLVWVWGISLISLGACQDRSHLLQDGHGSGDGNGGVDPEKPTQVPPQYDPKQFIEGSSFELSETVETFVGGKWVPDKSCLMWEISSFENGLVDLEARKSLHCDGQYLNPTIWERIVKFDTESGKVLSDEVSVNQRPRNGDLFEKKIFFYFFANGKEKDHFDTVESLKIEGQTYPAFTINSVSYLNAPGTSLHGLLLQRIDVAADKKQRVKWSLIKLNNLSPQ